MLKDFTNKYKIDIDNYKIDLYIKKDWYIILNNKDLLNNIINYSDYEYSKYIIIEDKVKKDKIDSSIFFFNSVKRHLSLDLDKMQKDLDLTKVDCFIIDTIIKDNLYFIDMFEQIINNKSYNLTKSEKTAIEIVKEIYNYAIEVKKVMCFSIVSDFLYDIKIINKNLEDNNINEILKYDNMVINIELEYDKKLLKIVKDILKRY